MESTVTWSGAMAFDAEVDDHHFAIDAAPEHGGEDKGPRPKGLALTALAGCTAMDVISILGKMRVTPTTFSVQALTDLTMEHPRVFDGVTLVYRFEGEDLPPTRLKRAIELSQERYCGVSAMLQKATSICYQLWINGEQVDLEPLAA